MKIAFLASGEFALPTLRWLVTSDHKVAAVVTQPARESGRGRRKTPTPAAAAARDLGLPLFEVEDVNDAAFALRLYQTGAELGLVIAFGQKLGAELRAALPRGFINLHASLLPKYRGAAPISRAILDGAEKTGVTVFKIVERMDAGPVLTARWTMVKPEETAAELHDRLAAIGVDAVRAALDLYANGASPAGAEQDHAAATRAPKLTKADGRLSFDRPAGEVVRHVRGMWSWPGANVRFESPDGRWELVTLARVRVAETDEVPQLPPGTLDQRRYVAARDAFLEILELKPASGPLMTWRDYVNGRHVRPGDRFVMLE